MTEMPEMIARMVDAYIEVYSEVGIEVPDEDFLRYLARTSLEVIQTPTDNMLKWAGQANPPTPGLIWAMMVDGAIHMMPSKTPSTN